MRTTKPATPLLEKLRRSGIEFPNWLAAFETPRRDLVPLASASVRAKSSRPLAKVVAREMTHVTRAGVASQSKRIDIDLRRLAAMGYITPAQPRSRIGDEFRVIKRPLLTAVEFDPSSVPAKRSNLLMVTSSMPGEGKTFVAVNLAISMAMELDKTVLLVDADVSRPSVLKRLRLPKSPGLLDLLTDASLRMSDVLLNTNIAKLSILPAGEPRGHATELLASDSMNRLLDELSVRYADRIVVFDTPPLLPSTESRVLATHMGQVILVIEASQTSHKTVAQAMASIESCPVVLPLLNKIDQSEVGSYSGYYAPR